MHIYLFAEFLLFPISFECTAFEWTQFQVKKANIDNSTERVHIRRGISTFIHFPFSYTHRTIYALSSGCSGIM